MFFLAEAVDRNGTISAEVIPAAEGKFTLLCGGSASLRSALLRSLSGLDSGKASRAVLKAGALSGRVDPAGFRRAYLPPQGAEIFAGATVEEELSFAVSESGEREAAPPQWLREFFAGLLPRSVWELSSAERRLLLLASQAAASPGLWLCDEPLACLDGVSGGEVLRFLAAACRGGAVVVAAAAEPAPLAGLADIYVTLEGQGFRPGVWDSRGKPRDPAPGVGETREEGLWFTDVSGSLSAEEGAAGIN
ncbi:hypothetical protein LLH00_08410 [bacterium]|nr:hypothetical protein [bacterium]